MKREKSFSQWFKEDRGFSLIELIIVIAIMAVLVAVIAPVLSGYIGKSKTRSDEYNAAELERIITYEVQNDMVNDDEAHVLADIEEHYDGVILRLDKLLSNVDETGEFKKRVETQLGHNDFTCKRAGYQYYVQISVESGDSYEVICQSVHASDDQLTEWP